MNYFIDIFVKWAKKERRFPLLLLLIIPFGFYFIQNFFELTFRETLTSLSFLIFTGAVIVISGVLYFLVANKELGRLKVSIPLSVIGAIILFCGLWQLKSPTLPDDLLIVNSEKEVNPVF